MDGPRRYSPPNSVGWQAATITGQSVAEPSSTWPVHPDCNPHLHLRSEPLVRRRMRPGESGHHINRKATASSGEMELRAEGRHLSTIRPMDIDCSLPLQDGLIHRLIAPRWATRRMDGLFRRACRLAGETNNRHLNLSASITGLTEKTVEKWNGFLGRSRPKLKLPTRHSIHRGGIPLAYKPSSCRTTTMGVPAHLNLDAREIRSVAALTPKPACSRRRAFRDHRWVLMPGLLLPSHCSIVRVPRNVAGANAAAFITLASPGDPPLPEPFDGTARTSDWVLLSSEHVPNKLLCACRSNNTHMRRVRRKRPPVGRTMPFLNRKIT